MLASPLLAFQIVSMLYSSQELAQFAFLYGILPTASSIVVFSQQYDAMKESIAGFSVLVTVAFVPIFLFTSTLISADSVQVFQRRFKDSKSC